MPSRAVHRHPLILLATLSAGLAGVLALAHLPAAILLGCMAAAMLLAVNEIPVRVSRALFVGAQGVVGCLVARSLQPSILAAMLRGWPLFLTTAFSVIAASGVVGWALTRRRVLPGTTAVWGLAPGAATVMILMAEAYGADMRLVAVMQYLRVVLATATAAAVSGLWVGSVHAATASAPWFPPVAWGAFTATMTMALLGAALAHRLRIPAGPMLLPLLLGVILQGTGTLAIELPPALLALAYAIIGWGVGLRFTRAILAHAARALPRMLASILMLLAICIALAGLLTVIAGTDPLTAYLAMSPGGADSIAIIAAGSAVDVPFVMAMQLTRFVMVLVIGPRFSRFVARRTAS